MCVYPPKQRHVHIHTLIHSLELYALLAKGWWKREERHNKVEEVKKKKETVLAKRRWDVNHTVQFQQV